MSEVYVADAHAFARYLISELPGEADAIFMDAEREKCEIFIPSIAIAELIYVFERTGSELKIWEMFDKIALFPSFSIYPLDEGVLRIIPDVKLTELHDRIIVGTSIAIKADGLITRDEEIKKSGIVKTVW
jgi:predicted nucleic acid-binding protein